ncbi:MAG TPA: hypothetical protein VGF92_20705 [Stellaceae bacterium]
MTALHFRAANRDFGQAFGNDGRAGLFLLKQRGAQRQEFRPLAPMANDEMPKSRKRPTKKAKGPHVPFMETPRRLGADVDEETLARALRESATPEKAAVLDHIAESAKHIIASNKSVAEGQEHIASSEAVLQRSRKSLTRKDE